MIPNNIIDSLMLIFRSLTSSASGGALFAPSEPRSGALGAVDMCFISTINNQLTGK